MIEWSRQGQIQQAQWRSESGAPAPRRVVTADDTLAADTAYRMACEGTGLLWQGDFQNARMLLQALMRRADARSGKSAARAADKAAAATPAEAFHLHRQAQAQRARVLASVLIPLEGDYAPTFLQISEQNRIDERLFDPGLNQPGHGTRAKRTVIAVAGQPGAA